MQELTLTALHDAILEANAELMSRFRSGDTAGIGELYTENGQIMPPNSASMAGREDIRAFWQSLWDSGVREIRLNEGDVEGCDDMAAEVSTFELVGKDGRTIDRGKYIVIWKAEDGDWKLHRDIFNSDLPAQTS
ncbi:MAG: YybH family protein [Candidatus Promineifilaceae bacterium]|jgi:ketosteroid isomerase-like protein